MTDPLMRLDRQIAILLENADLRDDDLRLLYLTNPWFRRAIDRMARFLPDLVAHLALKSREKAADLYEESRRIAREVEESMDEFRRMLARTPEEVSRDREQFIRRLTDEEGRP